MFALTEFPLPYATDALSPYISQETIETHHGKHVATYIDNLNKLIENTPYESMPLLEIIQTSANNPDDKKIFNNAAQIFNHNFFFNGMCTQCNTQIPEELIKAFGGAENLKKQFKDSATALFGSGYTWLVQDEDGFKIINTKDAETPITNNIPKSLKRYKI